MRRFFLLLALLPLSAMAAPKAQIDILFDQLRAAERPEDAAPIEEKIGALLRLSGSSSVDLLMTRVSVALGRADNRTARALLDAITRIDPHYAEGWHQRAGLQQAANDDTGAMVSLQKAVQDDPRDFPAMNDLAGMLEDYGDKPGALKLYRRVLDLDPQMEGVARHVKALARDVEGQGI